MGEEQDQGVVGSGRPSRVLWLGLPDTCSSHPPAMHDDGAGAAPVALVHLPARRNGCEDRRGQGAEHMPRLCFLPFSHVAKAEGERGEQGSWGWRERTRAGMGIGCVPGIADLPALSLTLLPCKIGVY